MKRTIVALVVTGALAGCTFRSNASPDAMSTLAMSPPTVSTSTLAMSPPTVATSAVNGALDGGGLFGQGASPDADPSPAPAPSPAVTAPSPMILLPVPPLPADMQQVRPSAPPLVLDPDEHDPAELTADDVVAEWIAAVYTGRYDDPPNAVADALHPLAASDTLVVETVATIGPVDVDGGEARWPYIVEIAEVGDGWWQASVLVKSTRSGQVGPTSTPITVWVHVTGELLVDDWGEQR